MLTRTLAHDLDLPVAFLRIEVVHAKEVTGKKRSFVATGAGPHFEKDVAFVVRVARNEQLAKRLLALLYLGLQPRHLIMSHAPDRGVTVFQHAASFG